jgi:hypothetical protein
VERLKRVCLFILGAVLALHTAGCGGDDHAEQQQSNIKALSIVYGRYIAQHRGQPPRDEAELRKFAQSLSPDDLKVIGAPSVDELFTSSRDKKPFGVRYGNASGPPGPAGQPVVIYEQDGVNGQRWVASSIGAVETVDEARFKELVPEASSGS